MRWDECKVDGTIEDQVVDEPLQTPSAAIIVALDSCLRACIVLVTFQFFTSFFMVVKR